MGSTSGIAQASPTRTCVDGLALTLSGNLPEGNESTFEVGRDLAGVGGEAVFEVAGENERCESVGEGPAGENQAFHVLDPPFGGQCGAPSVQDVESCVFRDHQVGVVGA